MDEWQSFPPRPGDDPTDDPPQSYVRRSPDVYTTSSFRTHGKPQTTARRKNSENKGQSGPGYPKKREIRQKDKPNKCKQL